MPDLLLELFCEEIPARMQGRGADDLKRLVTDALVERGLTYDGAKAFATPRRLALVVGGLPARQPDRTEERKGPRVGAPEQAIEGLLKAAGLASIDEASVQPDPKGDFYVARIDRPGRAATEVIAEIAPEIIRGFPWPKSMRWGSGALRWVRPLHSVVATFSNPQEDPEIVPFEIEGIVSGDVTRGHRVHAPKPFRVKRFEDYEAGLFKARVVLDAERRRDVIRADARTLAEAQGLELVEDEALIDEVSGLVEWPVALMGSFDEEFLEVPDEVIRATIRANQKCFVLRWPEGTPRAQAAPGKVGVGFGSLTRRIAANAAQGEPAPAAEESGARRDGGAPSGWAGLRSQGSARKGERRRLANRFVLIANLEAADGGAAIVQGNERVVRARLSDARFFWETDRKVALEDRLEKLRSVTFHEKLGTQHERVERIARLAREIAFAIWQDDALAAKAEQAARLAKADLVSEMVGEFPELQGVMGRYYAEGQGIDHAVAAAIEEHYRPQGPSDRAPTAPVSIAVALADKIDVLVGFWAIDEKPTGSKDPYALRRAALGVVRIVLENGLRLAATPIAIRALRLVLSDIAGVTLARLRADTATGGDVRDRVDEMLGWMPELGARLRLGGPMHPDETPIIHGFLGFLADRLKVQLREQGARHDLVDAVFGSGALPPAQGGGERLDSSLLPGDERSRGEAEAGEGASSDVRPPHPALRADLSPPARGEGRNDDLVLIVRRVEALGTLLETEDGKNLLAGYRRAANILKAEEKKDGEGAFEGAPEPALLNDPAELALSNALDVAEPASARAAAAEQFSAATAALAKLRPPIDAFFDDVTVNAPDPALRANRLKLLARLRRATRAVADFDRIAG